MVDMNPFHVDESRPWFQPGSGWPENVPKNMEFIDMTLGDMLSETVRRCPDKRVIWFLNRTMTYRELDELVDRFATALHQLGLKKGEVVALLLPNCFQYVVVYYACMRLGLIASGINPTYKPMEVLHQLDMVNARALVSLDILYDDAAGPILERSPVEILISSNITDLFGLSPFKRLLGRLMGKIPYASPPRAALKFPDLLKTEVDLPQVEVKSSDVATYIMTGGTTGVPKAAVLSHFNLVNNVRQSEAWLADDEDREGCVVGVIPFFHSFAMTAVMNGVILRGSWMLLFPRPPETREFLETIAEHGVDEGTLYSGPEVLFQNISELPGVEQMNIAKKFRLCVSGAGPLHRQVQEKFERLTGARLVEGYGLTEASPVVSANPFWEGRKLGSIGLPFPGTDWKIVDSEDFDKQKELCPEDSEPDLDRHIGEIVIAGPQVMVGYLNQPEETAETVIERNGKRWLLTGDIGYMDDKGRVYIRDRKKQLIKYKGYSIFPKEVEELVGGHESILEVAVAGLPDPGTGEKIKAWVVLRDEWKGKITGAKIRLWCRENMTHYKVPAYIEIVEEVPKNPIGKVLRRELQENDPIFREYHGK